MTSTESGEMSALLMNLMQTTITAARRSLATPAGQQLAVVYRRCHKHLRLR